MRAEGALGTDPSTRRLAQDDSCGGLDVIIPTNINGVDVTSIADSTFDGDALTSIQIPNTVTEIGYGSFYGTSISSLVIPNSVTTIQSYAFADGGQITNLTLSNNLTTISDSAFQANNIASINIPDSVTTIEGSAFYGNNLSTLTHLGMIG